MADNVELNPMVGGELTATDEIGGIHYQLVKIELGAMDSSDGPVSSSNKMPVRASEIETILGEVQASPTANTVLARLKSIEGYVDGIEGSVDGIEALLTTIDTDTGSIATAAAAIQTAVEVMDDWDNAASNGASVSGDVAHDAADAGEPVKVGYKAIAHGTNPTAVAANDRTNGYANRHGIPWVIGGHPNIQTIQKNITDADGAQTDLDLIGAISAGTKYVITHLAVTADKANTADVGVRIGFGSTNTPGNDAAKVVLSHPGIAAGSGVVIGNGGGIIGVGGDGEELRMTSEDPTGGAIDVVIGYYTIES